MHIYSSFSSSRLLALAALAAMLVWVAAVGPAGAETVVIVTSADCAALTAHVPMPGSAPTP